MIGNGEGEGKGIGVFLIDITISWMENYRWDELEMMLPLLDNYFYYSEISV